MIYLGPPEYLEEKLKEKWYFQAYLRWYISGKGYAGVVVSSRRTFKDRIKRENEGRTNNHHIKAIRKYPQSLDTLVALSDTKEEIFLVERQLILKHNFHMPTYGYNKTMGGEGTTFTQEIKERIKKDYSAERKKATSIRTKKRYESKEYKSKMAEATRVALSNPDVRLRMRKARSTRKTPKWTIDNTQIFKILDKAFPKRTTSEKQKKQAERWFRVFVLYFRKRKTVSEITLKLGRSESTISSVLRSISRYHITQKRTTNFNRWIKRRGRPPHKTQIEIVPARKNFLNCDYSVGFLDLFNGYETRTKGEICFNPVTSCSTITEGLEEVQ